ncbi:MAG: ThuA domain-containing protein [Lentisphaerae bacterium]|nr:ThuA domain-containing protein [Lentisphaerota bacterium]
MSHPAAIILVGSRWHIPWEGGELIAQRLEETGMNSLRTDQGSILEPERLAGTSLVVFYCEGRWNPPDPASRRLTPQQERDLAAYVREGGGFLGIHGATVFRDEYTVYPELIGGRFTHHDTFSRFTVHVHDPDHPITRGVGDFAVEDEPYVVDRYPGSDVLLSGDWDGAAHPLGWVKPYGKGRVCYLANGHDQRSLDVPEFRKLICNAAAWCAGGSGKAVR